MTVAIRCLIATVWLWKCLEIERPQLVKLSVTLLTRPFLAVRRVTSRDKFTSNVVLTSRATSASR